MSHNQSRPERTESGQYKKTGRSSSYQQRSSIPGGGGGKGGAGSAGTGASAPSFPSNQSRSSKKYNNSNAPGGGQYRASGPVATNNQTMADIVQNGARIQHPSPVVSSATPVATTTAPPVKPSFASAVKPSFASAVNSSDVSAAKTTRGVPKPPTSETPPKGPGQGQFPLQFGSVTPGTFNGVHVPARTNSAPPNIDEQKRDQAQHQTSSKAPANLPAPSVPYQVPKKEEVHSKLKREGQVSSMHQNPKPSIHPNPIPNPNTNTNPIPGAIPMQIPYHQAPFGVSNPQIQSQAMPMALPMHMGMPMQNPPMSQPVFVPNYQHHPHTMIHQGQGMNYSPPMGHQMHHLGNMRPPFAPQQHQLGGSGPRKVKITHPDTNEELRFDASSGPRSNPHMQPPVQSFPHHQPNFYNPSYNSSSSFTPAPAPAFRPISITPQPPRSNNQVTITPAGGSHGEKSASSVQSQSSIEQSKAGKMLPSTLVARSAVPIDDTVSPKKHQQIGEPEAVKDGKKTDQVGGDSKPLEIKNVDAKISDSAVTKEVNESVQESTGLSDTPGSKTELSKSLGVKVAEKKESESEIVPEKQGDVASQKVSVESAVGGEQIEDKAAIIETVDENEKSISSSSVIDLSPQDEKTSTLDPNLDGDNTTQIEEETDLISESSIISESSSVNEKSEIEANVTTVNNNNNNNTAAAPRGKKKRKELFKKANAAGTASDLYMAYKGPEEKNETPTSGDNDDKNSTLNTSNNPDMVVPQEIIPSENKPEPDDDWEDAADSLTPKLDPPQKQDVKNDEGLTDKKYSKDFLLKFAEQCNDLPDGFHISSELYDIVMVPNESSYPRPTSGGHRRGNGINPVMGMDIGYNNNNNNNHNHNNPIINRPGQGNNYGVLRTPHPHPGAMIQQHLGPPQFTQRNNSESDRWARGTGYQKGIMNSPQPPSQMMHKAERKYQIGKASDEEEAKQRQLKGILNKLTPQNFEKLFEQVKQVNIDNVITLTGVISQIFDKALTEPHFCEMYADFCQHLASELPDLSVGDEKITFKRLLLNKCQEEFERGEREQEEANKADEEGEVKQSDEEREEKRLRARRRMLGNIRLIGELYKKRMLTERIMHECIKKLLGGPGQVPDEEDIEALCKLMSTIGEMIDHYKAKEFMDAYFDMMGSLSTNMDLSSRVRFMLLDSIDLRKNKWQQRRKVEGPKKIDEVHRDAAQERQAQANRVSRSPSMNNPGRRGGPQMDFTPTRGNNNNMLGSPISQYGGPRGLQTPQQQQQQQRRHIVDNRPLPQRGLVEESITLGPQGGLGRGMSYRGRPSSPNDVLLSPPVVDPRRMPAGLNGYGATPERSPYGPNREDNNNNNNNMMPRYNPEWVATPSGSYQGGNVNYGNRDNRSFDRPPPASPPPARGLGAGVGPTLPPTVPISDERLEEMSLGAIKEFYSAKDEKEVILCVKELNSPSFYPCMISLWVTDSFERKDMERDLLAKLLLNLTKSQDSIINHDQLIKGFETVLMTIEDAVNDAPRAAEYLGRMIAKMVSENMISLSEIGKLILEGGEEQGRLVEIGLGAELLGTVLETIQSENGDSVFNQIRRSFNMPLETFRPPRSNKPLRLDKFII